MRDVGIIGRRGVRGALMLACGLLVAAAPVGRYRLVEQGPDVASEMVLNADGSFEYFLAAGALDEHAKGRWTLDGAALRLVTMPKPVPPVFSAGAVGRTAEAPLVLRVIGPGGGGIAGVDLKVGFGSGEDVEGYTQEDGWSPPEGERRVARWVEFSVPMHGVRSPRFAIDPARGNLLTFVLTPNDIGEVDFTGMPAEVRAGRVVVHRGGGEMVFAAVSAGRR